MTTPLNPAVQAVIEEAYPAIQQDYFDLLSIPSIGTLRSHNADTERAGQFIADLYQKVGLEHIEMIPTSSHPIIYGDWLHAEGQPTILIYAHYDVQPVDPLNEWISPPFEPTLRDDIVYARGACDDKANSVSVLHAVGAWLKATGALPVNVRFLIEGDEEGGQNVLEETVRAHADKFAADIVIIADGGQERVDHPALCNGSRGMLYTEIEAVGAKQDLHSGTFGGNAPNPLFALAQILTGLKDASGFITIPGVYDQVRTPAAAEMREWEQRADAYRSLRSELVGTELVGEPDFTPEQREAARPTLEVHGFIGGFQDEGEKTVIPARARVKVSMRLVPDQNPNDILPLLEKRVQELTPAGVTTRVRKMGEAQPFYTSPDSPAFKAAVGALEAVFGTSCDVLRGGGTLPIAAAFQEVLQADVMIVGFSSPDGGAHSPNELMPLAVFRRGIDGFANLIACFKR